MAVCEACGRTSERDFAFCPYCGAPLAAASAQREQRKTVTVLFCDVTGSTALGESTDPEALRALLARYFERMKSIVESHGGTVEKFIGDAVMAVFGVPVVHEDDALRAVRAAVEMRDALPELGVQARIGVSTGEVVTGTQERLATGDAVNVAARLEQAAQPGEILIGEETLRLVRDCAKVEAVEPLELKGKAAPVAAHRLLDVSGDAVRRNEAPLVGRARELDRLRDAFEDAVENRSCRLFTILGTAGVGKSRLAAAFLDGVEAAVVRGRCLSYGEGITYWPVVEVVKQLHTLPATKEAAASLRSLLGEADRPTSAEEMAWAFRKLLEERARERPLVCLFDDIHWGEPTFLDLVEHVADLSRDAPILLLCLARPELLDKRPGWGGGKLNATAILLEPLSESDTEALLDALGDVGADMRERIRKAAEGNPLFIEEMVALLQDAKNGDVMVPPTIHALLAARLDQLEPQERVVLEHASVEGRVFHRSAVEALAPEETQIPQRLVALVRKELVRPDEARLPDDDAYRFRHLLIRDAAYDALPKTARAELHERFAHWLEKRGRDLVELDEILGHHLEQAARYRDDLGRPDASLARKAGSRLAAAARRAQLRGDIPATVTLLRRSLTLLGERAPERPELQLRLGLALGQAGDLRGADAAFAAAAESAEETGDRAIEEQARIELLTRRFWTEPSPDKAEEQRRALARAIALFEDQGDELGLARAWKVQAEIHNYEGDYDARLHALERALRYAEAVGDVAEQNEIVNYLAGAMISAMPTDAAIERIKQLLERPDTAPVARANLTATLGHLHAHRGNFDSARALVGEAKEVASDFGLKWTEARMAEPAGWIFLLQGDTRAAEAAFRRGADLLEAMGESGRRAMLTLWRAEAVYLQGRLEDADRLAGLAEKLAAEDLPAVHAKVLAHRGELDEALPLAHHAVELARRFGAMFTYWLLDAAEVFTLAGRAEEARSVLEEALETYEASGNLVMAERTRERLQESSLEPS